MTLKEQRAKVAEAIGIVLGCPQTRVQSHHKDICWIVVEEGLMSGILLTIKLGNDGSVRVVASGNLMTAVQVAREMNPVDEPDEPDEPEQTDEAMIDKLVADMRNLGSKLHTGQDVGEVRNRLGAMTLVLESLRSQIKADKE